MGYHDSLDEILNDSIFDLRDVAAMNDDRDDLDEEERERLDAFLAQFENDMGNTVENYAEDEPTVIANSYFEDYARELAEDIGAIKGYESWPLTAIDWDQACAELQADYSDFTFEGTRYWIRDA